MRRNPEREGSSRAADDAVDTTATPLATAPTGRSLPLSVRFPALPWVAALLTMVFWASSFVVIRDAAAHFNPGAMALLRCLAAAAVLSLWMLIRRPRFPSSMRAWLIVALWGVAWFAAYVVVLNVAEHSIDAGTASMIVNVAPLIIAVFAGIVLREGLPWRLLLGILISLGGIGLITAASFTGVITLGGLVLSLVAAVLYAACVLLQKHFLSREDSVTVTWLGILAGTVACLVFTPSLVAEVAAAPIGITLQVVYLGVVPTAIAFNLWGFAIRVLPAGLLSSSSLLVPAIVVLLSWIILAEVPPPLAAAGGVLCLVGAACAIGPQIVSSLRASAERSG